MRSIVGAGSSRSEGCVNNCPVIVPDAILAIPSMATASAIRVGISCVRLVVVSVENLNQNKLYEICSGTDCIDG